MKRTLLKWAIPSLSLALFLNASNTLAAETQCIDLKKTLDTAFPDLLEKQPHLKDLTKKLGPYAQKTKVGSRYEWENGDFLLIIQKSHKTTSVSIIPEKIEAPGKPTLYMPESFQNVLKTTPNQALATAKKSLGTKKMKEISLYEYTWKCVSKAKTEQANHVSAQFDNNGDFIALLY